MRLKMFSKSLHFACFHKTVVSAQYSYVYRTLFRNEETTILKALQYCIYPIVLEYCYNNSTRHSNASIDIAFFLHFHLATCHTKECELTWHLSIKWSTYLCMYFKYTRVLRIFFINKVQLKSIQYFILFSLTSNFGSLPVVNFSWEKNTPIFMCLFMYIHMYICECSYCCDFSRGRWLCFYSKWVLKLCTYICVLFFQELLLHLQLVLFYLLLFCCFQIMLLDECFYIQVQLYTFWCTYVCVCAEVSPFLRSLPTYERNQAMKRLKSRAVRLPLFHFYHCCDF